MTRSSDDRTTVEQRLTAALHTLAETQIPALAEQPIVSSNSHSWTRLLSVAAAALIVVAGGTGIVLLRSEPSPTTGQSVAPRAATSQPASDSAPSTEPAPTGSTVETATTTTSPTVQPLDLERIGILDPAAGFGPAETLSEVDRWLGGGTEGNQHFAIRGRQTDDPIVLRWAVLSDSEWTKTYSDQPAVELADGRVAKRLIPTLVDVVNYAIETDDGVFSASITPDAEPELAQWFSDVAGTDTILPPEGFEPIADVTDTRSAFYGDDVTLSTSTFDRPIELDDYLAARFPDFSLQPTGDQGALVATPPDNDIGFLVDIVIWQPQPDLIVTAGGPLADLDRIADALTLSDTASADLGERRRPSDPNIIGEPDLTVLGETSEGRFAYTQSTRPDGTVCSSFIHNAHGGGDNCRDDPTVPPGLDCGGGWSSPDEASASVFVLTDVAPDIKFTIDGEPLDPNIETGTTGGVAWVFAWVRETGRASDDPSIETTVNQTRC